jgi:putative transposase
VKYAFMARHRSVWPVRWMSEALGASASGFYEWLSRPESNRSMSNRALLVRIRESFESSHRTYGSPRVWRDLHDWRVPGGLNRIARIMRQAGLVARPRLRRPDYSVGKRSVIAPNLLGRQFTASAPNQKWVADFTYVATGEGWLYLAVVLDLYSRMVVGWSMQKDMSTQLVADAMTMALWRRRPDTAALLHHSDQGTQYASEMYQKLLEDNGITCSMSRAGNVWDNSAMESFFSSMKSERVHRSRYRTRDEARSDIFDYIERFYNPQRRHSTLDYVSPATYEESKTTQKL